MDSEAQCQAMAVSALLPKKAKVEQQPKHGRPLEMHNLASS